jgi:hypothetical protein
VLVFDFFRVLWLGVLVAVIAVAAALFGFREGTSARVRTTTLALLILLLLFLPQLLLIVAQPPNAPIIDGVVLNDVAADRLLSGHDPYVGDYLNTAMRAFYISDVPVNFGLSRFVYMPGMALLDVPLRMLHSDRANLSWLYLPALLALAAGAWTIGRSAAEKQAAVIVVTLNPLFQLDYFYLLNDIFFLAPALAGVGMLRRGRPLAAGALLGLSLGMKQQAVLLLPLLALYAVRHMERRDLLRLVGAGTLVVGIIVLPFVAWDPKAFLAGTAGFFYGSGVDHDPIRGLGLQGSLLRAGVVDNRWAPFPSAQIQVPLLVITLAFAVRDLYRRWSWVGFWAWLGLESLIVFIFGRVLAPNYIDLVLTFFLLAFASALVGDAPVGAVQRDVEGTAADGRPVGDAAEHDTGHLPAL